MNQTQDRACYLYHYLQPIILALKAELLEYKILVLKRLF